MEINFILFNPYLKLRNCCSSNHFVRFCFQLASDVHNTMRNIDKRLKQESGADIVGEKLFALYLAVREAITYRSIGEAK